MALDPEEFKRRREERTRQRQAKAAKARKKRIVWLVLAGILLILGIVVLVLSLQSCQSQSQPEQTTTENPPNTTTIHLAATGDLNVTEKLVASGVGGDYSQVFMDVLAPLAQADITTLNFEGGLYGQPYGQDASAPAELAHALKNAGVDLVQLANSYTIAKGSSGLRATVSGMQAAGLTPVGAYATAQDAQAAKYFTMKEVNGIKIAFVSFTKGFRAEDQEIDSMSLLGETQGCVNLLYKDYSTSYQEVDTEGILQVLSAAEKAKPDVTVALLHWGSEYTDTISVTQQEITTLMQENGVDAIIGTHSHFVQKMEHDPQKGTFIAYSLGDFLSSTLRPGSEYSVILDLEITKDNDTGDTKITSYSYTPIYTQVTETSVRSVRIQSAMSAFETGYLDRVSQADYDAMKYALERIEARIKGE